MADNCFCRLEQPVTATQAQKNQPQIPLSGFGGDDHVSPTQVLDEAAVEDVDDDYWDVLSDEEMQEGGGSDEPDEDAVILSKDFSLIRRIHLENTSEITIRRYDAFIYEGILSHYKAEHVANPLKNPKTARVFAHFIHVTGPVSTSPSQRSGSTDHVHPSHFLFTKETREIQRRYSKARPRRLSRAYGRTFFPSRP